jgi:hypothetical protein
MTTTGGAEQTPRAKKWASARTPANGEKWGHPEQPAQLLRPLLRRALAPNISPGGGCRTRPPHPSSRRTEGVSRV